MQQKLIIASAVSATLQGLVEQLVVPLPMALFLFEAKVEGILASTRWLWAGQAQRPNCLDEQLNRWAKAFLGAAFWRNSAVARSELGWHLGGNDRCTLDAAMRRARLSLLPPGDLYKNVFSAASAANCGWAARSLSTLKAAGVTDWPEWTSPSRSLSCYRQHVIGQLYKNGYESWRREASNHSAQVPYLAIAERRGGYLTKILGDNSEWDVLLGTRAHCRLRAGLITLRSQSGRTSRAKFQDCIFCAAIVRNATSQILGKCKVWQSFRHDFARTGTPNDRRDTVDSITLAVLRAEPGTPGFNIAVSWSVARDEKARSYWKGSGLR